MSRSCGWTLVLLFGLLTPAFADQEEALRLLQQAARSEVVEDDPERAVVLYAEARAAATDSNLREQASLGLRRATAARATRRALLRRLAELVEQPLEAAVPALTSLGEAAIVALEAAASGQELLLEGRTGVLRPLAGDEDLAERSLRILRLLEAPAADAALARLARHPDRDVRARTLAALTAPRHGPLLLQITADDPLPELRAQALEQAAAVGSLPAPSAEQRALLLERARLGSTPALLWLGRSDPQALSDLILAACRESAWPEVTQGPRPGAENEGELYYPPRPPAVDWPLADAFAAGLEAAFQGGLEPEPLLRRWLSLRAAQGPPLSLDSLAQVRLVRILGGLSAERLRSLRLLLLPWLMTPQRRAAADLFACYARPLLGYTGRAAELEWLLRTKPATFRWSGSPFRTTWEALAWGALRLEDPADMEALYRRAVDIPAARSVRALQTLQGVIEQRPELTPSAATLHYAMDRSNLLEWQLQGACLAAITPLIEARPDRCPSPRALARLCHACPNGYSRSYAVKALIQVTPASFRADADLARQLYRAAIDGPLDQVDAAQQILAERDDPTDVRSLFELLRRGENSKGHARLLGAWERLASRHPQVAAEVAKSALAKGDAENLVRRALRPLPGRLLEALANQLWPDPQTQAPAGTGELLEAMLRADHPDCARFLLARLGRWETPGGRQLLWRRVREFALIEALPLLEQEPDSVQVRQAKQELSEAQERLQKLDQLRRGAVKSFEERILEKIEPDASTRQLQAIVMILAKRGSAASLPALIELYGHEDPQIATKARAAARKILGRSP